MSPPNDERRPGQGGGRQEIAGRDTAMVRPAADRARVRARIHEATTRQGDTRRATCSATIQPEHYGLSRAELQGEVARCVLAGWAPWELRTRFVQPDSVPVAGWSS